MAGTAGYIHIANEGVLTTRIADMMSVGSPLIVLFITFLIGGLLGGVSALSGVLIKQNLIQPSRIILKQ